MAKTTYTSKDKVPMRIWAGVKNDWTVTMKNSDGTVLDITGYTYYCQVRDKPGGKLLAEMNITTTPASGIFAMSLPAAESVLIGDRSGVYDVLQEEDATPTNVTLLYRGEVEIHPIVTEIA